MSKVNEQKALETIIEKFYGNCTVEDAQKIIDDLLDMGLAKIKNSLNGKKVVLIDGWDRLYDTYKLQSAN